MNHIVITNPKWMANWKKEFDKNEKYQKETALELIDFIKKKYGVKKMDEEQEKTIIKNLKNRLEVLLSCKKNRVSQIATIGHDLKILIDEIEEIENALHVFKGNDDEDC